MDWNFPFRAQRMPVLADNLVVSSQPLASFAGTSLLQQGGNAVDAALAAAAVMVVVEPSMNGLGSDTQAIVFSKDTIYGLNSSGRSPSAWNRNRFAHLNTMPDTGWDSVTVPGTVSGWIALWRRFSRLPLQRIFAPAIHYARHGFPVSPVIARQWAAQTGKLKNQPGFEQAFMPGGHAPKAGERFAFPDLANAFELIANSEGKEFYQGSLAQKLIAHANVHGGVMSEEDLASHEAQWVEPITHHYRSVDVHQLPPNAQGLAVQIALGILSEFEISKNSDPVRRFHLQIEAMKIAFADVYAQLSDPKSMKVTPGQLLDPAYLKQRARQIDIYKAGFPVGYSSRSQGTIYLAAADQSGLIISLIQSNFHGFGSGVVVPETGISLNNRASGFSLQPGHPNEVDGGKQPFHTIIPGLLSKHNQPLAALGVVGANMQPQGQLQLISALCDLELNPQSALDMPRWRITDTGKILLEEDISPEVAQGLQNLGHTVSVRPIQELEFGGAQMIYRQQNSWLGAADPRRDSSAVGF